MSQAGSRQTVVLVVDHEVTSRNQAADILHRDGYLVLAAAHGKEAVELSDNYHDQIDIVIVDMNIPKMGSMDLCESLRRERPGIKVLLMSANPSDKDLAAARKLPFLLKPLEASALRKTVRELLR